MSVLKLKTMKPTCVVLLPVLYNCLVSLDDQHNCSVYLKSKR